MANEITGGDLYHLWRVGKVHLPRVADVYYDAASLAGGGGSGGSDGGFRENAPAYPGATYAMTSTVAAAWSGVSGEMQEMFTDIGTVILDAAEGVETAIQTFIGSDCVNDDELQVFLADKNKHDPDNPASNPPVPGDEDYPVPPEGSPR